MAVSAATTCYTSPPPAASAPTHISCTTSSLVDGAQLHRLLHQPVQIGEHHIDVTVSIGAASPRDLHTRDLSQVLRGAEGAMYEHKQEGHGDFRIATPAHMNAPMVNGRRLGRAGTGSQTAAAVAA
jgi:predicted signal transduction protein with EAL and GGDEF domain